MINNTIEFSCPYLPPYPCTFQTLQYIKVADIVLENFDIRSDKYIIELSGSDSEYFLIDNLVLYIKGEVLDFNQPDKTYSVSVKLIDASNSTVVVVRNHSVCVFPCECVIP